jgi:16S rRNA (guanine527-N7)-methyltransferase
MTHPPIRAELPRDPAALPPLPETFWVALDSGLPRLGLTLTDDARRAIDAHVRLLLAWNAAINLTAITAPATVATRHVLDSLTAVPPLILRRDSAVTSARAAPVTSAGAAPSMRVLDLGSGGGFPGLPLAAALPELHVTLAESVAKKARFLEAAVDATGLRDRVVVSAQRAESLAGAAPGSASFDVVTARAVAPLDELVELAMPLLRVGGRLLAWKSGDLAAELAAARRAGRVLGAGQPTAHRVEGIADLAGHVIVEIEKRRPTPAGYPRDPARRRARSW